MALDKQLKATFKSKKNDSTKQMIIINLKITENLALHYSKNSKSRIPKYITCICMYADIENHKKDTKRYS